jgi:hypothetical protein
MAYPAVISTTSTPHRPNGIQVLPIMWRQDIKFGMAADDEDGVEADLGTIGVEDGCPTLDELTLEGVPNIRTVVSDVLMDGKQNDEFYCVYSAYVCIYIYINISATVHDTKIP